METGWVLGMDASGPGLAVAALGPGGTVWAEWYWNRPRTASTHLLGWVALLVEAYGPPAAVGVGRGPGSFTGVRIAVTAAKMLAFAWEIPVKGVSSLAAWALAAPSGHTVVVTSERRGEAFYAGCYRREGEGVRALAADVAASGTGVSPWPGLQPEPPVAVTGVLAGEDRFRAVWGPGTRALPLPLLGSAVARLARTAMETEGPDDPETLLPAYVRPPGITRPGAAR
ncbi:putative Inactive homolog of metal-dependent proteases, molecular chaperone [Candidatus Hydrogenisulfobacillus filiaventi]|uniref:Putative Inactive homolog of metal-dependent proteases, molecular chaperone n=1 Tax=Candidatus Hydrogenisulfobacillus filiaventi TaxID=2707344 RepID=A0A6F8ZH59_9FIRM|nr:tRNA (adenosine(37)-N6)-threonylcarbamoyltransferase complex dimerization subunit type 1 TsaB [Bacillota bacterium]CAB1129280.1 putative Inactive homolog of metal-dependent proteases, molecular chaperone [Candidatus Hydrogenisulfobacillus filiaventi]